MPVAPRHARCIAPWRGRPCRVCLRSGRAEPTDAVTSRYGSRTTSSRPSALEALARSTRAAHASVLRSRIVLLAAQRQSRAELARRIACEVKPCASRAVALLRGRRSPRSTTTCALRIALESWAPRGATNSTPSVGGGARSSRPSIRPHTGEVFGRCSRRRRASDLLRVVRNGFGNPETIPDVTYTSVGLGWLPG